MSSFRGSWLIFSLPANSSTDNVSGSIERKSRVVGLSDSIVTSTAVSPEVKRTTVPSAELLAEAMPGGKVAEIADVEEAGPAGVVHPAAAN